MSNRRFSFLVFFLSCVLGSLGNPVSAFSREPNQVESIIVTEIGESMAVIIETERPLKYFVSEHKAEKDVPAAILIHFEEPVLTDRGSVEFVGQKMLRSIRLIGLTPKRKSSLQFVKTVALELEKKADFKVKQKDWTLSITLTEPVFQELPETSQKPASNPMLLPNYKKKTPGPKMNLPPNPKVKDFVRVALANHKPLEIAYNELRLAKKRLFEARRTFFPALSGRASETTGKTQSDPNDASTVANFKRRELGLEFGQPLFQSGRIFYTEKQARVQKQAAELELQKLTQEVTYEVLKDLYTYVRHQESLRLRRALLERVQKVAEQNQKKRDIGVISESEALGSKASSIQVEYKMISEEKDLEIAKLSLLSSLNVETLPQSTGVQIDGLLLKLPQTEFNSSDLVNKAIANRPDLKIANLARLSREYAQKVARAENLLELDASGFIGQSGAAFSSEELNMKDSFNVGIQATLYFSGSSLAPLFSKEKTAPDLGSTSRTETDAQSVELGVLDSLSNANDYLEAKIEAQKAIVEFNQTKKDMIQEVKEALFNYQKGLIQLTAAEREISYRKKELAIADAKNSHQDIEPTQYLSAMISETESEINYKEAIVFTAVSLISLEKAIGANLSNNFISPAPGQLQ